MKSWIVRQSCLKRSWSLRPILPGVLLMIVSTTSVLAERPAKSPTAALAMPVNDVSHPGTLQRPDPSKLSGPSRGMSWLPPLAVTGALMVLGAISLVVQRGRLRMPGREPALVRVVSRITLTPRHAIHVVQVGDRTLLMGTGAGGPPALLVELDLPARSIHPESPESVTSRALPQDRGASS